MNKLLAQWGAVLLIVATVYTVDFVSRYWPLILVALFTLLGGLCLWKTKRREPAGLSIAEMRLIKRQIQQTIADTPKLKRYDWSDDFDKLHVQWEEFEATGKTPMRKRAANRKLKKTLSMKPTSPIEMEALRIRDQIRKSAKLQRYVWSDDNTQLIAEWRQYEATGKSPIKKSTAERRASKRSEIHRPTQQT